ncbi:MAG: hypothetical protein M0Z56_05900 [Desulfobacteraceae bacterium]|nr:hypothetical protein [Desulfobacteraceae bacterium]
MNDSDGSYCCQSTTQELTQTEVDDPYPQRVCFVVCGVNGSLPIRV